jgi:hypothetical protein
MPTKKPLTKKKLGAKAPAKKVPKYHLEVRVNDVEFKTDAEDMVSALSEFINSPAFPFAVKTKVFVKYSKGDVERSQLYHVPEARKVFKMIALKPSARELLAFRFTQNLA